MKFNFLRFGEKNEKMKKFFSAGNERKRPSDFYTRYGPSASPSAGKKFSPLLSGDPSHFQEFLYSPALPQEGKLSSGKIRNAIREADQGFPASQAELYRSILEKEPVIAAHLQTRILAITACDWSIAGPDEEKRKELTAILQHANIQELLRHLLNALAFGCSAAAILWEEGGKSIHSFREIAQENLLFDAVGNPALRTSGGKERPLSLYHPAQFVLHYHKLKQGPAGSGGLLRPLLWLYFFKHYALRDRARYLEKFGIPFIVAKISQEDFENEEVRRNILASLSRISSDGSGVVTGDSQIQTVACNGNSSGEYQSHLEYIDKLFALLILGQTASSSTSSGFSKGQIQENVRKDILEADCRSLMATVNTNILAPLEKFRYGTQNLYSFHLDFASPENLTEKAEIVKLLSESGFSISPEWVENAFHITLEQKK